MSNIYIQEPPTSGKVLLQTTVGDIDIELWSRECPKTCRNFVQLCMEGFYNELPFYQIIPNSYAICGDPTCTGEGGESVYGKPFKDELHSRLRFVRRGLVAMVNRGEPNTNTSQFLITFAATPELERKNSLFGKVTGETLFNALRLSEAELDANGRPKVLHRILRSVVLSNPFEGEFECRPLATVRPDLVERERERAERERPREAQSRAVKNVALLSFGELDDEEQEVEDGVEGHGSAQERRKPKMVSSHDVLEDPKLSKDALPEPEDQPTETERALQKLRAATSAPQAEPKGKSDSARSVPREKELADEEQRKRKAEIRRLQKELAAKPAREESAAHDDPSEHDAKKQRAIDALFGADLPNSSTIVKRAELKRDKRREEHTLALLDAFSARLRSSVAQQDEEEDVQTNEAAAPESEETDDTSIFAHRLQFAEESARKVLDPHSQGEERYDIYDPRNPLAKRRRVTAKQRSNRNEDN